MAIKETAVLSTVCDICGKKANGSYDAIVYCNQKRVAEMSCPHELCKEHMEQWQHLCEHQATERYSYPLKLEQQQAMLQEFKELLEE